MTAYYEKPKGWNEAPRENWVCGTPIGQNDIAMPKLGDPDAHEDSSTKVSFGDDMKAEATYRVGPGGEQIKPGQPCPPGTETRGTICAPSESGTLGDKAIKSQFKKDKEKEEGREQPQSNWDRDYEKAPEPDAQIRRIAKEGYRGRG